MTTFTLNWNDLSINKITSLFLYAQLDTPTNLQDETLIRQPEPEDDQPALTEINLTGITSFMIDGPGEYANGAQFALVQAFMTGVVMPFRWG